LKRTLISKQYRQAFFTPTGVIHESTARFIQASSAK
jgi:hypothetical protein